VRQTHEPAHERGPRWKIVIAGDPGAQTDDNLAMMESGQVSRPLPQPETSLGCASPSRIVFVVTEDWFFASHFLPLIAAAHAAGLEAVVVTRVRAHRAIIEATGARVLALEAERRDFRAAAIGAAIRQLTFILKREKPAIVHCISLRPILIGGMAARLAGIRRVVFALTGLGLLGARTDLSARLFRRAARLTIRRVVGTRHARFVLENPSDARFLGLQATSPQVTLLGGAGVDPALFPLAPMPDQPPLRIAVIARMLWSKGIDTAVEAVRLARQQGVEVTLSLYGQPDPSNPRAISPEQLEEWTKEAFVDWHGHTNDVAAVWASHHVACLPSRGGEGLPRTLLEAAACGRAILTTNVPGCRDFVRHERDGYVLPVNDPVAFANAISALAAKPVNQARMGQSARERVLSGYTIRHVIGSMAALYRALLRT